jgi:hypothetical protein
MLHRLIFFLPLLLMAIAVPMVIRSVPKRTPSPLMLLLLLLTLPTFTTMILILQLRICTKTIPISNPPILPPFSTPMQDFKWKKSISAILKSNHGQMPLDTLSAELVASFHAAFATRLAAVVEAKVRSSKKLKLVTAADGRTIVTSNKE